MASLENVRLLFQQGQSLTFLGSSSAKLSSRSEVAYALKLHLPSPRIALSNPSIQLIRQCAGYSELLDAVYPLWAFARTSAGQVATFVHCLSGRSVSLVGINGDELVSSAEIWLFSDVLRLTQD